MKPQVLLKLGVVLSSALLMAAFVAYRAGAFGWLTPTSAPPSAETPVAAPEVKAPLDSSPTPNSVPPFARLDSVLMSSSKSMTLTSSQPGVTVTYVPTPPPGPPPGAQQKPPTLMVGPKSAPVFVQPTTPWAVPNDPPPPPAPPKPPTIMPGSKSIALPAILPGLPPPQLQPPPPAAQQPTPAPQAQSGGPRR